MMKENEKCFKDEFEQRKYQQINQILDKCEERVSFLQSEATWFIGMLIYDHAMERKTDEKSRREFLRRVARCLRRRIDGGMSTDELQNAFDSYLAYPLLEEVMIENWLKGYDIRDFERLRPELMQGRDELIGKIPCKGQDDFE